jgi:hypothetical protein
MNDHAKPSLHETSNQLNDIIKNIIKNKKNITPAIAFKNIQSLMQTIRQTRDVRVFNVKEWSDGMISIIPSQLGMAASLTLNHCTDIFAGDSSIYRLDPYIDVFVQHGWNQGLVEKVKCHTALNKPRRLYRHSPEYHLFWDIAESMDKFMNEAKREMYSRWFKDVIYEAQRLSVNNNKGLRDFIDSLFANHSRLLLLRVDFHYHKGNIIHSEADRLVKYQEARHDREQFITKMKSASLFTDLLGYVWKLEYGPEKGFHYHMMFLFDGSWVREDVNLAMRVGKYWEDNITQGRGTYHNCNAEKNRYSKLGIGMINYYDTALREGLYQAASYLTKADHMVRALLPGDDRAFGRGLIQKPKSGNGPGRPRSYCSEEGLDLTAS